MKKKRTNLQMSKLPRAPIVTILGHVDHGKTSLLDSIRKSNIAEREAGGITQTVGASKINTKDGDITFIDTPGHAAFSSMRERGVSVADIVVLVVAADDGPMPQTTEVIKYLKKTKTPFVVAITKMDLPSANLEKALSSLEKQEILFEGRGGDVPFVEVSSKSKKGIDDLLETILLLTEVSDISGSMEGGLQASVVESHKDKRGVVGLLAVKSGSLKIGESVKMNTEIIKIRGLFNDQNKPTKSAGAGEVISMIGFTAPPPVGSVLSEASGQKPTQKEVAHKGAGFGSIEVGEEQMGIVIRALSLGPLDAVRASLPENVIVLSANVGEITENDVLDAKQAKGLIIAFDLKVPSKITKLAATEGVRIKEFKVIYDLVDFLTEEIEKMSSKIKGSATVLQMFPFNKQIVAGVKIDEGVIQKGDELVITKKGKEIGKVKVTSMRKMKNEIEQAKAGEESGILFTPQVDFSEGDVLTSFARK